MSSVLKPLLTPQEYLARERKAEFKSEFYRGEMFPMAGASWEHTLIKDNTAREAGQRLRDGPCRVLTSDLRVKADGTGLYSYPDVIVVCEKPQFEDDERDTLLNPKVVIEVMADATEDRDRGIKFSSCRQIPSVREYVLIAQDRPYVEGYFRRPDDSWLMMVCNDITHLFAFGSIPVKITLTDIYRGVEFPENAGR